MIKVVTISDLCQLIQKMGLKRFFLNLIEAQRQAFSQWETFQKIPRHATHHANGVYELMPIMGEDYFSFKYVNGHPYNPKQNKLTVVALGVLADGENGYPLMISEMTLLTAFRTAAVAALTSQYCAKITNKTLAIIGTGSQSEFLVLAHYFLCGIERVQYFDIDVHAMEKFANNCRSYDLELQPCPDARSAADNADILITATANKERLTIIHNDWIKPGQHIIGLGGDCPGKTELDPDILNRSKIIVEFLPQTLSEGEIQNLKKADVYAELWEIVNGLKSCRLADEITLFDSVGFALEDYAALKFVYQSILESTTTFGQEMEFVPVLKDPKNLYALLTKNGIIA